MHPGEKTRRQLLSLLDPARASSVLRALADDPFDGVAEALADVVAEASARPAALALEALRKRDHPLAREMLRDALDSPHASVRTIAVRCASPADVAALDWRVREDASYSVRALAVERLAQLGDRELLGTAASDPSWRVRHALIRALPAGLELGAMAAGARAAGVCAYWAGDADAPREPSESAVEPDPAVLRRQLGDGRGLTGADALRFAEHEDPAVRRLAYRALHRAGSVPELTAYFTLDPRVPDVQDGWAHLAERLDTQRLQAVQVGLASDGSSVSACALLALLDAVDEPLDAWSSHPDPRVRAAAVRQSARGLLDPDDRVRAAALARGARPDALRTALGAAGWADVVVQSGPRTRRALARHHLDALGPEAQARLLSDSDAIVRREAVLALTGTDPRLTAARRDPDHRVRAAAMARAPDASLARADVSSLVWRAAAEALRLPVPKLVGIEPWDEPRSTPARPMPIVGPDPDPRHHRDLGRTGLTVSPLGLSGHYGLGEAGFIRGLEAGINFSFWEPRYEHQTRFYRRIGATLRERLVVTAGTFEAAPARVRADLERTLRMTGLEHLDLFLVFWVRSSARLADDTLAELESLRRGGLIRAFGLSTHRRDLAVRAIEGGIDPVMVRISAAHRGAEEQVLPTARDHGTGVIAFSNLCYGRLLAPAPGSRAEPLPAAWECYRYVMDLPGVTTTLTAPADDAQLRENLRALDQPLTSDATRRLITHGDAVHAETRRFARLIRER